MPFSIHIIGTGNKKEFLNEDIQHYTRLMRPYSDVTLTCLKTAIIYNEKNMQTILKKEADQLYSQWPVNSYSVALSEEGKIYTSKSFSQWLSKIVVTSQPLVFTIGSAHGLHISIKEKCRDVISLSSMTFPYRLCVIILMEQFYRAFTILKGHPYHK